MTSFFLHGRHVEDKDCYMGYLFLNSTYVESFCGPSHNQHSQGCDGSLYRPLKFEMGGLTNSVCLSHLFFSIQGNEFWKDSGRWKSLNWQFLPCQHPHFPNDQGCELHLDTSDKSEVQWEMLKSKWCLWSLGTNNTPLKLARVNYLSPSKSVCIGDLLCNRDLKCVTFEVFCCHALLQLLSRFCTSWV